MDPTKLLDWLKLTPKHLFPIVLVTGTGLFSPSSLLDIFGLTSLMNQYRPYIGIVFLIFGALLLTEGTIVVYQFISRWYQTKQLKNHQKELLQNLTEQEKIRLRHYIHKKTKNAYFDMADGVVGSLEIQGIVYKSVDIPVGNNFAYNIQTWAWDYLNENPHLLNKSE